MQPTKKKTPRLCSRLKLEHLKQCNFTINIILSPLVVDINIVNRYSYLYSYCSWTRHYSSAYLFVYISFAVLQKLLFFCSSYIFSRTVSQWAAWCMDQRLLMWSSDQTSPTGADTGQQKQIIHMFPEVPQGTVWRK